MKASVEVSVRNSIGSVLPRPRRASCSSGASIDRSASTSSSVISVGLPGRRPGCGPRRWRRPRRGRRAGRRRSEPLAQYGRSSLGSNGWRITGHVAARQPVEPRPLVGAGQADSRGRRGSASSTTGSRTSTAGGWPRPARGRRCGWRRRRAPRGPTRRTAPTRGSTSARARRAGARASDRACGARRSTPKTSQSVAWRSTVVVSASQVAGGRARPRDQQRDVAQLGVDRHRGLAPDVRARRGSGRGRCRGRRRWCPTRRARSTTSRIRPSQWSIIESLAPYWRAEVPALALVEAGLLRALDGVRRPDEALARPSRGRSGDGPRLGRVERLVRIELVDDEQDALVGPRGAELVVEPAGGGGHRRGARGSRPRRGTRCGDVS